MRMLCAALRAALAATAMAVFAAPALADDSAEQIATAPEWRLVWNDEFDGNALDPTKWRARVTPQYHSLGQTDFSDAPRHLRVEDGVLKLIARRAPDGRFASAMVETQRLAAWDHGRFEARIRVPKGKGTNAAFWMMHRDPTTEAWPLGGEIDILEQLGRQPKRAYGTLHFPGANRIDNGGTLDLDRPFFMMLSNVIGGKWPGQPGFFARWPKVMEIDWVRVYQRAPAQEAATP